MADSFVDTPTFLEAFGRLENERDIADRGQLLHALYVTLSNAGHLRLTRAEQTASRQTITGLFVPVLFWGVGASIGLLLGLSWPFWLVFAIGLFIAFGVVATRFSKAANIGAGALLVGWTIGAVAEGIHRPSYVLWTHVVPVLGAAVLGIALRSFGFREARNIAFALAAVGRSAPYVAPVVLLVILLPALTGDVWRLASAIDSTNLIEATVVSVGLLLYVVVSQLQKELEPALATRTRLLARRVDAADSTRAALTNAVGGDTAEVIRELPDEVLTDVWPESAEEYVPYLVAAEGGTLRRPLTLRLLVTTAAVGSLLAGYIYVLLAVTVPVEVAERWSGVAVSETQMRLFGLGLKVPGGAYIEMALLLGIFATAIFLAFVLTEERIASALTEALLREPIDRFLVLAIPFVSSLEWLLENQEMLSDSSEDADDESDRTVDSGSGSGSASR